MLQCDPPTAADVGGTRGRSGHRCRVGSGGAQKPYGVGRYTDCRRGNGVRTWESRCWHCHLCSGMYVTEPRWLSHSTSINICVKVPHGHHGRWTRFHLGKAIFNPNPLNTLTSALASCPATTTVRPSQVWISAHVKPKDEQAAFFFLHWPFHSLWSESTNIYVRTLVN